MKIVLSLDDFDIEKRLEQFKKHKSSGSIMLEGDDSCFFEFKAGEVTASGFKGIKDKEKVIESFKKLKKGRIAIVVEKSKKERPDYSKVPFVEKYVVVDSDGKFLEGDKSLLSICVKMQKVMSSARAYKEDFVFVRGKEKCFAAYCTKDETFFAVLSP
ncbi:MAG: hypothetical protein AB7T10_08865, partial [bacterium]